jgi:hypothetical protein
LHHHERLFFGGEALRGLAVFREWKKTFRLIIAEVAKRHLKIEGLVRM